VDLANRVVIVTGASRGIGRQLALEFGRRGALVVVAARTVDPRRTLPGTVGETADMIEKDGGRAIAVRCDVGDPTDVEQLVAKSIESFGRLDIVVNNAVDMMGGDFEVMLEAMLGRPAGERDSSPRKAPLEEWLDQFAVNVHGPYVLTTLATPHLRAQGGGVIVNITSDAAEMVPVATAVEHPPVNTSVGYHVTKAALNRLTNSLAARLAADNIAVVAIDPGGVLTEVAELLIGRLDPSTFAPMSVPVATVMEVVTAEDPMAYSGQVIRAQP
jgi:NAD(P)-dependent dehydrogenase (short-subunit alcohol dehydrogenase family)